MKLENIFDNDEKEENQNNEFNDNKSECDE